jgi:hypothetical protein
MGKVKQGKRLSSHRSSIDPMGGGGKVPLADEIESLRLAKSKSNDSNNNNTTMVSNKRAADHEDEFVNEKITAKILAQARKQQSELQDEYGCIDLDEYNGEGAASGTSKPQQTDLNVGLNDDDSNQDQTSSRPFKRFQSNFKQQQKIRKSDHDDSDSDSDVDLDNLENSESKRRLYSDEEVVSTLFSNFLKS